MSKKIVFVGMSGGVDSSVAAFLLKKKGYDVVGVFMRCWSGSGPSKGLGVNCAERDAEDARRVAEHIGIPFYVWDFEEAYKKKVMEYMIEGYRNGITPNPDVMCNKEIKFGLFLEKALAAGADFVATGHYVKIKAQKNILSSRGAAATKILGEDSRRRGPMLPEYSLFAAKDRNKDQSYFLWTLTQSQLAHCIFPIGDYVKPKVREIARKAGLPTAAKKDSQGICFLGDISISEFLKQYIPEKRGALVTTSGENIGEHFGAEFYTIGQRHIDADFKFPKTGVRADRAAFYVAAKDAATNTVTVAQGSENAALFRSEVELANVHFINANYSSVLKNTRMKKSASGLIRPNESFTEREVYVRVRYRQPLSSARISGLANGKFRLSFNKPQKFIAPGQSAVWYSKSGEMLGGGVIL